MPPLLTIDTVLGAATNFQIAAGGQSVDWVTRLDAAGDAMAGTGYDLVLLDLMLPDGRGITFLRSLRTSGDVTPVIILTALDQISDRIKGLDAGADDYLVKPFALDELAARLRAMLRRPGRRTETVLRVGDIAYDTANRVASVAGRTLDLARREADLLELMIRKAGQVVRRPAIEDALYRFDEAVTPNAIEAIVSRLRRKLDEAGATGQLHTVRGVGYLLRESTA